MDWQTFAAVGSLIVTATYGGLALYNRVKSDSALDVATNIKSTYDTLLAFVNELQEEVKNHRQHLEECETGKLQQAEEIKQLKEQVKEHEKTIKQLQVGFND